MSSGAARAAFLRLESEVRDLRQLVLQLQERVAQLETEGSVTGTPFSVVPNSSTAVVGAPLGGVLGGLRAESRSRYPSELPSQSAPGGNSQLLVGDLERLETLVQIGSS